MKKLLTLALALAITPTFVVGAYADESNQTTASVQEISSSEAEMTVIKTPFATSECLDRPATEILETLADSGFTNINITDVKDLADDQGDKLGTVALVAIANDENFSKDQEFPSDAEIIVGYHEFEKCRLDIHVDFESNAFFSKYDVNVFFDEASQGTLKHGEDTDFQFFVEPGSHTITFEKADDPEVSGAVTFDVQDNGVATIGISCNKTKVSTQNTYEAIPTIKVAEETDFPEEMAHRTVVTAVTNLVASDVYIEDGNTYDPEKFHPYSDTDNFHMTIESDGSWKLLDKSAWHVDNLLLKNSNFDTYFMTSCDVVKDGDTYAILNLLSIMSKDREDVEKVAAQIEKDLKAGKEFNIANYQENTIGVEYFDSNEGDFVFAIPGSLIEEDREAPDSESEAASEAKSTNNYSLKEAAAKVSEPKSTENNSAAGKSSSAEKEKPASGWQEKDGSWYYIDETGAVCTDQWVDSNYYVGPDGKMVTNAWVGDYYVGGDGAYVTDTWVDNYYIGSDGVWIPNYGQAESVETEEPSYSNTQNEQEVYWTETGKRWHTRKSCTGLNNANAIYSGSLSQAEAMGLTPCKRC